MFRPQIQKTRILVLIAIFNLLMVYFAVNSKVKVYQVGYDRKIEASSIMKNTLDSYKSLINYEISEKDLFSSGLLGVKTSLITTKEEVEGLDCYHQKLHVLILISQLQLLKCFMKWILKKMIL